MPEFYPFYTDALPYPYDALEPFIDAETMHYHHDKHYQGYVNKLNNLLKKNPPLQDCSLEWLIINADTLPCNIACDIRNNAGGVYNHKLYFKGMTPDKQIPSQYLLSKIKTSFGSFNKMENMLKEAALDQFGSGYAWLVADVKNCLRIIKTNNQNVPDLNIVKPLLLIDVWEHAYYLKYQNRRRDYINSWFELINWNEVENRLNNSTGC